MNRTVSTLSFAAAQAILRNGGSIGPDPAYPDLLLVAFNGAYVSERHSDPAQGRQMGSWSEYEYRLADGTVVTVSGHRSANGYGRSALFLSPHPDQEQAALLTDMAALLRVALKEWPQQTDGTQWAAEVEAVFQRYRALHP